MKEQMISNNLKRNTMAFISEDIVEIIQKYARGAQVGQPFFHNAPIITLFLPLSISATGLCVFFNQFPAREKKTTATWRLTTESHLSPLAVSLLKRTGD